MNDESDIPLCKEFFRLTFVQYVAVRQMRIWTYKNADEKEHSFCMEKKKRTKIGRKEDGKQILSKSIKEVH